MLNCYRILDKILNMSLNLLFVIQIVLVILVFLTCSYWFFDLIGSDLFSFAEPVARGISDFVRLFYTENIEVGGVYVDGSLLLFDIIALLLVFGLSKFKFYIYNGLSYFDHKINKCKADNEEKFNESLEKDIEDTMMHNNNVAILIRFEAKNMLIDNCWGGNVLDGVKEHQEEAFKIFYNAIKTFQGCKFARTDDKMLILLNNFEKIDELLAFIETTASKIKNDMKKDRWLFLTYISIEVYDNKTDFKLNVYPVLEKLLALNHKNEPVCLSNFCLRYKYKKNPQFTPFVKGRYNINGDAKVWALVKKN